MESRKEKAVEMKKSGKYNCAQSVACAYCDVTGVDEDVVYNTCNGFGRGMGCMEGTCGTLTGASVVLGLRLRDRKSAMEAMARMMTRFKERNGSTVCRELKGIDTGKPLRACNDCVADAAEFLASEL